MALVHEIRSRAQVYVARRPGIVVVVVELLFQSHKISLMLSVIEMIFWLKMLNEMRYAMQHIFWTHALCILFDDSAYLFQVVMLIHIRQGYKAVSVGTGLPLIFCSECHTRGKSCVTAHGLAVGAHVVTAGGMSSIRGIQIGVVDVAIRA